MFTTVLASVLASVGEADPSPNVRHIVGQIQPSVHPLLSTHLRQDTEALVAAAVRANIHATVARLEQASPILGKLIREDGLLVVGAEYSLETGAVEFFGEPV